jgi:hypothetical protein
MGDSVINVDESERQLPNSEASSTNVTNTYFVKKGTCRPIIQVFEFHRVIKAIIYASSCTADSSRKWLVLDWGLRRTSGYIKSFS